MLDKAFIKQVNSDCFIALALCACAYCVHHIMQVFALTTYDNKLFLWHFQTGYKITLARFEKFHMPAFYLLTNVFVILLILRRLSYAVQISMITRRYFFHNTTAISAAAARI